MEQEYLSIKLAIFPIGNRRFRSRLEPASGEGSNFGLGDEFELVQDLAPDAISDFVGSVSSGLVASANDVETFGRWLYEMVFRKEVLEKFGELKGKAAARNARLRICLALRSPELINIPWEFLHDGTNFLQARGYSIVRVLDELAGTKSSFAPIRNVLLASANPKGDYDEFDASEHLEEIKNVLTKTVGKEPTVMQHVSADQLRNAISSNAYDAFYFVGHGEASDTQPRIICEKKDGTPDKLEANLLAQALRKAGKMRFVYLNSCSTGKAAVSNSFQGVAQRLMLDGNVAAVAAMQVDVRQKAGITIAREFFQNLSSQGPEMAMDSARGVPSDGYSFGIPVLYTYLDAPEQLEKNYLQAFLRAGPTSKFALMLPSYYLGLSGIEGQPAIPKKAAKKDRYPGRTFATADTNSAVSVCNLLGSIAKPEQVFILPLGLELPEGFSHYFLFGGISNPVLKSILRGFSSKFEFSSPDDWYLSDLEFKHTYRIPKPSQQSEKEYSEVTDYGVLERLTDSEGRIYFIIAGLGSRGTEKCGAYLYDNWRNHVLDEEFAKILEFIGKAPGGRLINRPDGPKIPTA